MHCKQKQNGLDRFQGTIKIKDMKIYKEIKGVSEVIYNSDYSEDAKAFFESMYNMLVKKDRFAVKKYGDSCFSCDNIIYYIDSENDEKRVKLLNRSYIKSDGNCMCVIRLRDIKQNERNNENYFVGHQTTIYATGGALNEDYNCECNKFVAMLESKEITAV